MHRLKVHVVVALTAMAGLGWTLTAHAQPGTTPSPSARSSARADSTSGGPEWNRLTAAQRRALAPLERDWTSIEAERKAKWLEIANRFPGMPPDEQQRVHDRMTEWTRMTPAERTRARLSFQEAKRLTPQERQASWEAYQALPDNERKALATRSAQTGAKPPPVLSSAPAMTAVPKQNVVGGRSAQPPAQPLPPAIVQAKPGATTTPINKRPSPPAHQQPGQPKIAATPGQVDRATLLPRKGPVEAASASRPRP